MVPASRSNKHEERFHGVKDRKTRKPLVEKQRRARINESLQELRLLLDADGQVKMENAEVLEMTVRRVETVLQHKAKEADSASRAASERFAAGYIQCMHEVHTFVSSCPGIDATIAADLLNHLLECMPLNDERRFHHILSDLMPDFSAWPSDGADAMLSPGGRGGSAVLSPTPSTSSSDDLCSDPDDTDTENSHISVEAANVATTVHYKSMWRPW